MSFEDNLALNNSKIAELMTGVALQRVEVHATRQVVGNENMRLGFSEQLVK
ncbi:MAG: hypothetical protein IPF44_11585 [Betaproteobacteria bacterium]|nr:hypothetical protein [Betaproteobacteria bacterium]